MDCLTISITGYKILLNMELKKSKNKYDDIRTLCSTLNAQWTDPQLITQFFNYCVTHKITNIVKFDLKNRQIYLDLSVLYRIDQLFITGVILEDDLSTYLPNADNVPLGNTPFEIQYDMLLMKWVCFGVSE